MCLSRKEGDEAAQTVSRVEKSVLAVHRHTRKEPDYGKPKKGEKQSNSNRRYLRLLGTIEYK